MINRSFYQIGVSGSHRTGKTLCAERLSEELKIPFIETKVSEYGVWDNSIKFTDTITFAERIQIQELILNDLEKKLLKINNTSFIMDRTPFDVLAYLLTNIDLTSSSLFDTRVNDFIKRTIELTAKYFNKIIIVPLGIPFVIENDKTGKVYNSFAYKEALTNCIIGLYVRYFNQTKTIVLLPEHCLSLNQRLNHILKRIDN